MSSTSPLMGIQTPPIPVIIFGAHVQSWMCALGPDAPVWKRMPGVASVSVVNAPQDEPPLASRFEGECPVLIPLMERHIRIRPAGFREFAPSVHMVDVLANKKRFSDYLRENGLAALAPRTYEDYDDIVFPCLIKRTDLNAGSGIVVIENRQTLEATLSDKKWQDVEFLFQELIDTPTDYAVYCVCQSGAILWHCSYVFERSGTSLVRGSVENQTARTFEPGEVILTQIERVLVPLKFNGPCCVDYKIGLDGEVRILEVNPRLGGSLMKPENVGDLQNMLSCLISNAISNPTRIEIV